MRELNICGLRGEEEERREKTVPEGVGKGGYKGRIARGNQIHINSADSI